MSPLINDGFNPGRTEANERECVEGRINIPQSFVKSQDLSMTEFLSTCMDDFLVHFPPDSCIPLDHKDIPDTFSKPSQHKLFADTEVVVGRSDKTCKDFIKAECYGNVKPPRVITTIQTVDKNEWTRFTYPSAMLFKTQPWYGFSKTPRQIAERVAEVCYNAETHAINSDFSRFDGYNNPLSRNLEEKFMLHVYPERYHDEIIAVMRTQYNNKAVLPLGTSFHQGYSRSSGSPETSQFNSLVNAFIAYYAFRKQGLSKIESWSKLGVYGGDDGLTADINPDQYVKAARSMGFKLETEPIMRGDRGIMFLSRCYSPNVWNGEPSSMCDVRRILSKFHMTPSVPLDPATKLVEKCRGLYFSDSNTPLVGPIVIKVVSLSGGVNWNPEDDTHGLRPYLSRVGLSEQYPNALDDWMHEELRLALREEDTEIVLNLVNEAKSLDDIMRLPLLAEMTLPVIKPGKTVIIDEQLCREEKEKESTESEVQEEPEKVDKGKKRLSKGGTRRGARKGKGKSGGDTGSSSQP
jgi:hypothetical protein